MRCAELPKDALKIRSTHVSCNGRNAIPSGDSWASTQMLGTTRRSVAHASSLVGLASQLQAWALSLGAVPNVFLSTVGPCL